MALCGGGVGAGRGAGVLPVQVAGGRSSDPTARGTTPRWVPGGRPGRVRCRSCSRLALVQSVEVRRSAERRPTCTNNSPNTGSPRPGPDGARRPRETGRRRPLNNVAPLLVALLTTLRGCSLKWGCTTYNRTTFCPHSDPRNARGDPPAGVKAAHQWPGTTAPSAALEDSKHDRSGAGPGTEPHRWRLVRAGARRLGAGPNHVRRPGGRPAAYVPRRPPTAARCAPSTCTSWSRWCPARWS